jgi:hypothetical protein
MTAVQVHGTGRPSRTRRPPAGRHRQGRPSTVPDRREWDSAHKARATQLDLLEPGWLVLYGPYYRRFYAIARTSTVAEAVVEATGIEELRSLMRQAETAPAQGDRGTGAGWSLAKAPIVPEQPGGRWRS